MADLKETNQKIANTVVEGYKRIETGVVSGYQKIEDGVVSGYKKIEDKFIDTFLTKEGETAEDARARLNEQIKNNGVK